MLNQKFKQRCKHFVPEYDKFIEYFDKIQAVSVRVNTHKTSVKEFLKNTGLEVEQVPWYKEGFFVKRKAVMVVHTLEYFLGHLYMQDAASMLPPLVLNPKVGERILDMTAAPGSKTTQMSQMLKNQGCIIANDNAFERIRALKGNMDKLGCMNIVVLRTDARRFPSNVQFDKILLDTPCSLEGSMRKYYVNWSESHIRTFATLQKKMISRAWGLLAPGGTLVYSTCTYAPEENEGVVQFLMNNNQDVKIMPIKIKGIKMHPGLSEFRTTKFDKEIKKTARVYIHDYNTCGFYLAKLRKKVK